MIKFLVDSSCDLTPNSELCDLFVPISVTIDGKIYKDGIDLNTDTFYELLTSSEDFPKTAQPSPAEFTEVFEQIKNDGDEIICFLLSSGLSGTYQSANIAKSMVDYDKIYIVDTKTATRMIGVLVKYARDLAAKGVSASEIVEKCEQLKSKVKVIAGVDTLEYLYKGGRLSRTSAAVGTLAGIKPIITVTEDGKVETLGKCIGKARTMQFIQKKLDDTQIDENFPIISLYTVGEDNIKELESSLKAKGYDISERLQIGSTIGAHIGPNVYGILYVQK